MGRFYLSFIALVVAGFSPVVQQHAWAEQAGLATSLSYIGEGVSNVQGGVAKDSVYLGTGDLSLEIDTEAVGWWHHGTWFIEFLHNQGADPSSFIGDMQTASNIADGSRTQVQQFWYQQTWGDNASLLIGWHDLNSEFYVSEFATLFLNSSFGIGPDISANVPTSLWPEAGFAVRLDLHSEHRYLHIAAYDGDPSTRKIDVSYEGLMWIAETAYLQGSSSYKLGIWTHTADKIASDGSLYTSDYGGYAIVDYAVDDKLGVFMQLGIAPQDRNDVSHYFGLGLHVHGIIPSRHHDTFGIALARAGFSSVNRNTNNLTEAETTVEITYDMPVTDYLSIHPAYQWIQHPSGDKTLATANVAMLRFEMSI